MKVSLEMFAALEYQGLKFFCDVTNVNRCCFAREHKQLFVSSHGGSRVKLSFLAVL